MSQPITHWILHRFSSWTFRSGTVPHFGPPVQLGDVVVKPLIPRSWVIADCGEHHVCIVADRWDNAAQFALVESLRECEQAIERNK